MKVIELPQTSSGAISLLLHFTADGVYDYTSPQSFQGTRPEIDGPMEQPCTEGTLLRGAARDLTKGWFLYLLT